MVIKFSYADNNGSIPLPPAPPAPNATNDQIQNAVEITLLDVSRVRDSQMY